MTVDDVSWHDGVLLDWHFIPAGRARARIELMFALYSEQIHAARRNQVAVRCEGVQRFVVSCDAVELRDHAGPGNVVDGGRNGHILRVFLTGGFIEVEASSFRVRQGARKISMIQARFRCSF
jgi:hypothetical protein